MDDTEIIDLFLTRSENAISKTAQKYGAYLHHIAFNILRCHEDTEEVVDDTYLAAWKSIPPENPRVFKHFLSRIVRNIAYNRLDYLTAKRRDQHMVLLLSELDACIPDNRSDMDSFLESKQIGITLNKFLASLHKQDCAVFLCRYYYGMTIHEIGAKYCLSDRKIKYILHCQRQCLRKMLSKEGITV